MRDVAARADVAMGLQMYRYFTSKDTTSSPPPSCTGSRCSTPGSASTHRSPSIPPTGSSTSSTALLLMFLQPKMLVTAGLHLAVLASTLPPSAASRQITLLMEGIISPSHGRCATAYDMSEASPADPASSRYIAALVGWMSTAYGPAMAQV